MSHRLGSPFVAARASPDDPFARRYGEDEETEEEDEVEDYEEAEGGEGGSVYESAGEAVRSSLPCRSRCTLPLPR